MSLLDKATIITTPTAHSNGVLHSIKGGTVADFDVVRGSAATRVNAEGLIEDISVLSGELVTNGDFSNGTTSWTLGTGWSISDGVANFLSNGNGNITQPNLYVIGKTYKITFTISNYVEGYLRVLNLDNSNSHLVSGNGVYSFTDVATATSMALQGTFSPSNFSIDNISVVEVIDATNIPRIDYTTGEGVVLLEPQSTNLFPYSEDFSVSDWSKNRVTINSNQNISPNNKLNASKMIETAVSGNHQITKKAHSVNGSFTNSVFAKKGENNYLILGIWDGSSETIAWFDLENGLIGTVQGTSTQTIEKFGDYYRCSVTFDISASGGYELIGMSNTDGLRNYNGDGTSGVYIWGAQLEALSYPTSYIPTSGAIATRLADKVTGAGDATTFNSTEGVLYAEMSIDTTLGVGSDITLIDSSNAADFIRFTNDGATNKVNMYFRYNGVSNFHTFIGDTTIFKKYAIQWGNGEVNYYVNGVLRETDFTTMPTLNVFDKLHFSQVGSSNRAFTGKVKSVITFNTALTDEELTCLTTI